MALAGCTSTVLTLIPITLAIFLLEAVCQTKDTISRSRGVSGLIGARRFVCVDGPGREVPGFTGRAVRCFSLVAVTGEARSVRPIRRVVGQPFHDRLLMYREEVYIEHFV